jgi:hypothetical protein
MDVLVHSERRRATAERILRELQLVERWSVFGRPVIVGALAYDLMFACDIDMEVYCPTLRIEDGFDVLRACAGHPRVTQAQFMNGLATPDQALYWQIRCRDDEGEEWKIDMWSAPEDYSLPRAEYLVEPMRQALTPETRAAILRLKAALHEQPELACPSIHLYRAVMSDDVRTVEQWSEWRNFHDTTCLTGWKPEPVPG